MTDMFEKLKSYILEFTQYNDGRDDIGHYELVTTMDDNGEELLLWKLIQGGGGWDCNKYQVIESKHMNNAKLFPKEIKVVISKQRTDAGHATVDINRKVGAAILTPSSKSSDTVIKEQERLVAEYVNRSALNHFVDYAFVINWRSDHYQIDLTASGDWAQR